MLWPTLALLVASTTVEVWQERFEAHVAELDAGLAAPAPDCTCGPAAKEAAPAKAKRALLQREAPPAAQANVNCEKCNRAALQQVQDLLKTMYGRFKDDIVSAGRLEENSKKFFKGKTGSNTTLTKAFGASRAASHEHYRAMLKMSHAGMDRLKSTMDLVADKLAGKALDKDALQALKHSMPPVALAAVKADLRRFCREAQALLQGAGPTIAGLKKRVEASEAFQSKVASMQPQLCSDEKTEEACGVYVKDLVFCFELADELPKLKQVEGAEAEAAKCKSIDEHSPVAMLQGARKAAPEEQLAKEMTHDLEMNFNKIAPFGKEDTAKELQDHAADTQDTLVDAVENAEVAEIKRAVFRALTRLRAATIKEFDTIARLETQAIDAYNDAHHYRAENPLSHLHEDEAPVETDKLKSFH